MPGLRLLGVLAFALASITAATQLPAAPSQAAGRDPAAAARAGVTPVVQVKRHRGVVTGDGHAVFLANRTEFRPRRTQVTVPPRVRARSWVVVDLGTGRLLGKHNARKPLPQASTMKLLTAVTAARAVDRSVPHKVTRSEAHQICTCAGLAPGHYYTFQTLMEGMLLPSGNDAAEALAGSYRGGSAAFYGRMNQVARSLGARETVAMNASGLTAPGSHSSARDLTILLRAALRRPAIRHVMAMPSATIATYSGRHAHTVSRGTNYVNTYPHSLGKSGYTTPAKNTLVVATWLGPHHLAAAVMGAPYGYSTSDARGLSTWAAKNFAGLRAVGRLPHS